MSICGIKEPSVRERTHCPYQHSTKRYPEGVWIRGDDEIPGAVYTANGLTQVKMRCNWCGQTSGALPTTLVAEWGIVEYGWSKHHAPRDYDPCVIKGCDETPTEYHHFAPRNTFGAEAELWPCLPLCRPHHNRWHRQMDGYSWHRKATVA